MIATRRDFKRWCLTALGAPVIQINVADEQVEDRIDEALQHYFDFHQNGVSRIFVKHKVTQKILDNSYLVLPDEVEQVVRILPVGSNLNSLNNLQYTAYLSDMITQVYSATGGGLQSYIRSQSYLNLMNDILTATPSIEFTKHGNKLILQGKQQWNVGDFILLEVFVRNDPVNYPETWNDYWLKRYATALIKKQWANNLIKYNGAQLPSGITINGDTILQEANRDIEELERELRDTWEVPVLGEMA